MTVILEQTKQNTLILSQITEVATEIGTRFNRSIYNIPKYLPNKVLDMLFQITSIMAMTAGAVVTLSVFKPRRQCRAVNYFVG